MASESRTPRMEPHSARKREIRRRLDQRSSRGHILVADTLGALGVTHVYTLSGTPIDEIPPACVERGVRPIGVRHQAAGVMMALAQNYVGGGLNAAAVYSAGPAITNATTGVLVAHDNGWPALILGGRRSLAHQGIGYFQEFDAVPLFRPITKWADTVRSTKDIPRAIAKGYEIAVSARPGPVYLDLPEDCLAGTAPQSLDSMGSRIVPERLRCDSDLVSKAAEMLLAAKRPAMIIGKGVRWSVDFEELRELAERLSIPFITSPMGRGFVSDQHPLCCNSARALLQEKADIVLVLGARLNWVFRFGAAFAAEANFIHVDAHQPELKRNIRPTVGVEGDLGDFVTQLLMEVTSRNLEPSRNEGRQHWLAELERRKNSAVGKLEEYSKSNVTPMTPHRLAMEIRDYLSGEEICVGDGNYILGAVQQLVPACFPASRLDPGTNGCMGVGIPFAIGAKMANPDRKVITIIGDTGAGLSLFEMETAIRHQLPFVAVLANNSGISGRSKQKLYPADHPERVARYQQDLRYDKMVEAIGGHGEFVEAPHQVKPALERAFASEKPACVNVIVDEDAPFFGTWGKWEQ